MERPQAHNPVSERDDNDVVGKYIIFTSIIACSNIVTESQFILETPKEDNGKFCNFISIVLETPSDQPQKIKEKIEEEPEFENENRSFLNVPKPAHEDSFDWDF